METKEEQKKHQVPIFRNYRLPDRGRFKRDWENTFFAIICGAERVRLQAPSLPAAAGPSRFVRGLIGSITVCGNAADGFLVRLHGNTGTESAVCHAADNALKALEEAREAFVRARIYMSREDYGEMNALKMRLEIFLDALALAFTGKGVH